MDNALVGHNHAKSALDLACWDLFGKSVNLPVCELLGGSTGRRLPVISSIHADTPDAMRENVAKHRELGYLGHSVKIGAVDSEGGPVLDAERIKASLADQNQVNFYCGCEWWPYTRNGIKNFPFTPKGLDFVLEAPCKTWRETKSLRQRCDVPFS